MYAYSLGLLAAAAEAAGFWFLLGFGRRIDVLAGYFAAHAVASALASLVLVRSVPGPSRRQPGWAFGFFFTLCFFIPVLGVPGLLASAFVARVFPKRGEKEVFSTVAAPEFAPHDEASPQAVSPHAHGPVRAQLTDPYAPVETRMRALLSIQDLPSRMANPVIRNMLSDKSDDVRLVAYGILDGREKRINGRIRAARTQLEGKDPVGRLIAHKELAELYWELVYQGLVQGDLQTHAAAQASAHMNAALRVAPEDAALWALGGRLANFAGDYERAWEAFTKAVQFGLPEARVLPYLAEVAYRMRRFGEVRDLLERIAQTGHTQRMAQVIGYWNELGRAAT